MSRYFVEHQAVDKQYCITFGWDFPLNTFFAQVELETGEEEEEDELLIDIGSPFDCLYTQIDSFHSALLEHLHKLGIDDFSLSMEQRCQLLQDKDGIEN